MKFKDIKDMSNKDIEAKIQEIQLELMKERAQVAAGTVPKSPGLISALRKDIARMKTAMRQRAEVPKA